MYAETNSSLLQALSRLITSTCCSVLDVTVTVSGQRWFMGTDMTVEAMTRLSRFPTVSPLCDSQVTFSWTIPLTPPCFSPSPTSHLSAAIGTLRQKGNLKASSLLPQLFICPLGQTSRCNTHNKRSFALSVAFILSYFVTISLFFTLRDRQREASLERFKKQPCKPDDLILSKCSSHPPRPQTLHVHICRPTHTCALTRFLPTLL